MTLMAWTQHNSIVVKREVWVWVVQAQAGEVYSNQVYSDPGGGRGTYTRLQLKKKKKTTATTTK